MRLVVFFDLPVGTAQQRKEYRLFRKSLIKEGYLMMQESVYSKLVVNDQAALSALQRMKGFRPPEGMVQVLKVTEKQYATIVNVTGQPGLHEEMDTSEEFVVL